MFKENFAYIILALVAIALIGITIGLQLVILTDQPGTADGTMTDLGLRASVNDVNSGQATGSQSTSNQQGDQVALNIDGNTEQPELIVLEPSNDAPTPTEPPPTVAPTSTPLPNDEAESIAESSSDENEESDNEQPLVEVASAGQQAVAGAESPSTGPDASLPKETVMGATNVTTSDDNSVLAAIVASDPFAISFIPFAFYQDDASPVRAVGLRSSNGVVVEPTLESLANGQYPLARPLFIYSTVDAIQERQEVREFINCYLTHVSDEIEQIGYFQLSSSRFAESVATFNEAAGENSIGLAPCNGNIPSTGPIDIVGSATVAPVTEQITELFQRGEGYSGEISLVETGTGGGFKRLCEDGVAVDIVNASRPITPTELETCRSRGIDPVALPIGADALVVIVNEQNTFVESLSFAELWHAFSYAEQWSDINSSWPDESIVRGVRRVNSGTLDFFVDEVFENDFAADLGTVDSQPEPAQAPDPKPESEPAASSTTAVDGETQAIENLDSTADVTFGVIEREHSCPLMTSVIAALIEREFQLTTATQVLDSAEVLYQELAIGTIDVTLCYIDPDDRQYMRNWLGEIRQIGTNHWSEGNYKMLTWAKGSVKASYRSEQRCLLDLLEKVSFAPNSLDGSDSGAWISENDDSIQTWLSCPYN